MVSAMLVPIFFIPLCPICRCSIVRIVKDIKMNKRKIIWPLLALCVVVVLRYMTSMDEVSDRYIPFYVGTYTQTGSEGIYKCGLSDAGQLSLIGLSASMENPSFLAQSIDKKYLLAVSENTDGRVQSFAVDADSLLSVSECQTGGAHPCHVAVNAEGQVLVTNYSGGSVGLLQLDSHGQLSALLDVDRHEGSGITDRQEAPHPHSVWFHPYTDEVIAVDLGTDELSFSTIDTVQNKLLPSPVSHFKMSAGAGPRHLAFHPRENWIYVLNELNNTVSLLKPNGETYAEVSTISTLPDAFADFSKSADIHLSNDGEFLYASNRGHNSLAIYAVADNGTLTVLDYVSTRGDGPRNFALTPDNNYVVVANEFTNNLISYKRDAQTGLLEYVSELNVPSPICVLF